ncbi:MAG: peptide chain release factor N(5)-glutamine methyltransferase [Phycisphaera sp.]|nr:MAG: peptide chain release factor N(5)-glutamine methyltransferase [Phycisphaera sp.]
MTTAAEAWTTRRLLDWLRGALKDKGIDDARLCAELLIAHVIGCQRLRLYMEADRPASPDELNALRALAKRALSHEPVQYLVGEASFYGIALKADKRALIPRPETQTLVDEVVAAIKTVTDHPPLVADACTGSGCVAIAITSQAPTVIAHACDIDTDALALAAENIERTSLADRISTFEGDLLAALPEGERYDAIVANPPYIPDDEWEAVAPNVKDHEPTHALRGGRDGLDLVRPLIEQAADRLRPGGLLAIEVATARAGEALRGLTADDRYRDAQIVRDFAGRPRVITAVRA